MLLTFAGMVMVVKAVSRNAPVPMMANWDPASNVTELKLDASRNALVPMLLTLAGIVMEVKLGVFWNTLFPMLVNWDPVSNVTEAKDGIFWNASYAMLLTLAGIVMEVKAVPRNEVDSILVNRDPASNITEVKLDA